MNQENTTIHFNEAEVNNLKDAEKMTGSAPYGAPPFGHPMEIAPWAGGGFFILLGAIFLISRNDLSILGDSQWLIWMLVPLYWVLVGSYHNYVKAGRKISPATVIWAVFPFAFIVVGSLIGWSVAWPFVLVVIGVATLLGQGLSSK